MERDFKGVWIPKAIWLNEKLTMLEKIVLIEIDSLDNENGCCASNEYLAKFCQCSERKITDAISKLEKLGLIKKLSFDGRTRILKSNLVYGVETSKKCEAEKQKVRGDKLIYNINKKNTKKRIDSTIIHDRIYTAEEIKGLIIPIENIEL